MRQSVVLLILVTAAVRLAFGAATGLGVDESYMVSAGRTLSLGYFDHPPAAWWLSWGAAHLFGTEAAIAVRLPFILLFALTTWLMARLGAALGGPAAGYWAAFALNVSPVFGITAATWVLPDGPLDCALTGAALCLMRALPARGRAAAGWWAGAGVCAGLALFSKYSAVLTIAGAILFLALDRDHRIWLRRWEPCAAAALALLVFSPVLAWNATHGWASFAFQGARASGLRFHPLAPFAVLGGEALFVLPWFWLAMMALAWRSFLSGWRERLLVCLAAPPIVLFAAISVWSSQRILFHWAAPGYLMLFPVLGRYIAASWGRPWVRGFVLGGAALCLASVAVVGTDLRTDWLRPVLPAKDPTAEGLDWYSMRDRLDERGLLSNGAPFGAPGQVVGVPNWRDAGKIAHALGPDVEVVCLNDDSRQFGFAVSAIPENLLLLSAGPIPPAVRARFASVTNLTPVAVTLRGRVVQQIDMAIGHGFNRTAPGR